MAHRALQGKVMRVELVSHRLTAEAAEAAVQLVLVRRVLLLMVERVALELLRLLLVLLLLEGAVAVVDLTEGRAVLAVLAAVQMDLVLQPIRQMREQ